ncbi:uncharacterized protein LOC104667443, partial [Rhinopithecus roxellana]|uniref:uncharacterized protein LOC104667443 n=1 Tax=Rhinopithecus roxellana TaxID=61622 RepID=UPI00123736DD
MSPCPLSPLPDPPPRFRPHDPRGRALAVFPKSPPDWGESVRGSTRVWNPREPRPCPEPLRALGAGTGGGVSAATAPYLARALPAATFQSSQRGWGGGDRIGGSDQGACATPGPAHPSTPSYRKPPPLLTTTRYAYPVTRNPGCNQEKLPSKSLSKQEQTWLDRPLTRLDAAALVFCAPRPGEDQSFVVGDSCLSCFSTNAHAPLSHNEPLRPTTDPGICRCGWKGPHSRSLSWLRLLVPGQVLQGWTRSGR